MTDALNVPVRRPRKETLSADFPIDQKPSIELDDESPIEREQTIVHARERALTDGTVEQMKFMEEPVEILIHPSREKNAPLVVDMWVNGKGAEFFTAGRWVEANCLPVNMPVITKRKYVEILAMSKMDTVTTDVGDATVERPHNRVVRQTSSTQAFSILNDRNPKGGEWLRTVMQRAH